MGIKQSITITAEPADVFAVYKNVSEWPVWDPETESASIDGEFVVGTTGKIKPKGSPETKIHFIEVTDDRSFTVECGLPLCKIQFIHIIEPGLGGTEVTNRVEFSGPLSPVFRKLIGGAIEKGLPDSLQGIKRHIESGL